MNNNHFSINVNSDEQLIQKTSKKIKWPNFIQCVLQRKKVFGLVIEQTNKQNKATDEGLLHIMLRVSMSRY